ncbi:hypothetical protein [Rhodococcus sp. ANT_H53B]|uniref:hypothetical protein n=1 Tax=Rhodococcus sp. ANT_H53B TaxID=2597357 RepID=UPI0011EC94A9|nr:hypothetical protein [Rhodococcus sp. ANT_H53B]KAA0925964.1 hypothetical protein FQ188_10445 [Rhodococcus sp. ANT_H53B]
MDSQTIRVKTDQISGRRSIVLPRPHQRAVIKALKTADNYRYEDGAWTFDAYHFPAVHQALVDAGFTVDIHGGVA